MPKKNKLIIATAGAGKTTFLVREALNISNGNVLITTFTNANEAEIRSKLINENNCGAFIPSNITIEPWFTFLLKHGVRPYQGSYDVKLFDKNICGLDFQMGKSGCKNPLSKGKTKYYWGENENFERFYFTLTYRIYSDKLSKFVIECNNKSNGNVIDRLSRIYSHIFIDEVQDLAGYDLELLKLLFKSSINIILVGDPRQVTYLTHHEPKYKPYKNGRIKEFVAEKCKSLKCDIDETTLKYSHRNNKEICDFSSKLFPKLPISEPCDCFECRKYTTVHRGVFIIRENQVTDYKIKFSGLTTLRYNESVSPEWNFGKSKGLTFERVLIYVSKTIIQYLKDGMLTKVVKGKEINAFDIAKFYVAVTRARHSVAIVYNYVESETFIEGVQKWVDEIEINEIYEF
jgi:DNA helicase II / ATP-dependent DNA helicase PcrA